MQELERIANLLHCLNYIFNDSNNSFNYILIINLDSILKKSFTFKANNVNNTRSKCCQF